MRKISRHTWLLRAVSVGALLTAVFLTYANTVDSLDLWGHLNAGRHIHQAGSLPSEDLFSYTTDLPQHLSDLGKNEVAPSQLPSEFKHWSMNLYHSWLGQLILFMVQDNFGLRGVGVLKSILFILTLSTLYAAMRKRGAHHCAAFFSLALVAHLGTDFNYSRPQIFSFFLFSLMLYLLADFRKGGRLLYGLPAVMLLWANIHGGFIMGVALLLLFCGGELIQALLPLPPDENRAITLSPTRRRILLLIAFLTLLAGLANPNGYRIFTFPLATMNSLYGSGIMEYQKPGFDSFRTFWFMLLLSVIAVVFRLRRTPVSEILPVLFWAAASLMGMRAIIYFGLGASVFLASSLTEITIWSGMAKHTGKTPLSQTLAASMPDLVTAIVALLLLIAVAASGNVLQFKNRFWYPVQALRYIKTNHLPGRLFNFYDWGGYINWILPDYKVFIDGRCLNETAFFQYNQIINGARGSEVREPLWSRLLDAHGIQLILVPTVARNGYPFGLTLTLLNDPQWHLLYRDGNSALLLRGGADNDRLYGNLYQDKNRGLLSEILTESSQGLKQSPATLGYYETMGNAYLGLYQIDKAVEMFGEYLARDPDNDRVKTLLQNAKGLRQLM